MKENLNGGGCNFMIKFQVEISRSNFKIKFQGEISRSNFKIQFQVEISPSNFKLNFRIKCQNQIAMSFPVKYYDKIQIDHYNKL